MPDELKEGDEVVLRGKVTESPDEDGNVEVTLENGRRFFVHPAYVYKVRPGTYEVTSRELVKMVARLFRYKELSSLVVQNEGRLNGKLQRRVRHFFRARLKELKRKRKQ